MVFKSKQPLKFSKFLKSKWLTDVKDHKLKKPTIVVNISNTDAMISGPEPRKVLPPRKSTILQGNDTVVMITIRYIGSLIHEFHTGSVEAIVAWHSGTCFKAYVMTVTRKMEGLILAPLPPKKARLEGRKSRSAM